MEAAQALVLPFLAATIVVGGIWYTVAHWNDGRKDKDKNRQRRR